MIAAGRFRDRVTVQARTAAYGSRGQSTESWSDVTGGSRWARVTHLSGTEFEQARQVVATATTKIEMRNPRSFVLTTDHRLVFKSTNYNIGAIIPKGDNGEDVEVLCSRFV